MDTGRPRLDFVSQSKDNNLPRPSPTSFDSALLIDFFFFFTTAFSFAIRALGIDAENFFHRVKVRKTSAKTVQEM